MAGSGAFAVEGNERPLASETALALYRATQEALTNAGRYATGAPVSTVLRYGPRHVRLTIANGTGEAGLTGVGGGRGLVGLRERVEQLGGTMNAGPTADGWCVEVEVPG